MEAEPTQQGVESLANPTRVLLFWFAAVFSLQCVIDLQVGVLFS